MDNIISVISICATILLGVLGFIVNSLVQRRNNSIEIITKKRLARRDKLQELSARILAISDPDYLANTSGDNSGICIISLTDACAEMRSMLEYEFKQDGEIVDKAYNIKRLVVAYSVI